VAANIGNSALGDRKPHYRRNTGGPQAKGEKEKVWPGSRGVKRKKAPKKKKEKIKKTKRNCVGPPHPKKKKAVWFSIIPFHGHPATKWEGTTTKGRNTGERRG